MRLTVVSDEKFKHVVSSYEVTAVNFSGAVSHDKDQPGAAWEKIPANTGMYECLIPVILAGESEIKFIAVQSEQVVMLGGDIVWPEKSHRIMLVNIDYIAQAWRKDVFAS